MPGLRGDIVTAITKMYPATCTMKIKPRTFSSEGPSLRDATGSVICLQKDESDLKRLKQTEHCDCCNTLQETRTDISCNSHQPGEKNTLTKRERVTLKLLRRDLQRLGLMFSRAKKVEEKVEEKVGKQNAEGLVEEINNYIWEQAVDLLDKPIAHTAVKVFHQSLTMLEKLQVPVYSIANRISHFKQVYVVINQPKLVTTGLDKLHHFLLDGSLLNVLTHLFHR